MKHYEIQRREANLDQSRDRGKDTVQQFGTLSELNRTVDKQLTIETGTSIRTRMDLLVAQYMLLRGEDRRKAEFPDLFTVDSLHEGVKGHVPMLCLRLGQGKVRYPQCIHWILSIRSFLRRCFRLTLINIRFRQIRKEGLNMALHFVIRTYGIVP